MRKVVLFHQKRMIKTRKLLFTVGCFALISGMFSSYAFCLYKTQPLSKSFTIGIEIPETSGFVMEKYHGNNDENTSYNMVVNPTNDKELVIQNVEASKGDRFKCHYGSTWYGTDNSYSHNISLECSSSKGVVSSDGNSNYVAIQDGHYDIYLKFYDSEHQYFEGIYVNVVEVKDVYLQDTWNEWYSPKVYFYGTNLVYGDNSSSADTTYVGSSWYMSGTKMSTQEGGHDMYKVVIPNEASNIKIDYQGKLSAPAALSSTDNSYWVGWDNGMVLNSYYWANPL